MVKTGKRALKKAKIKTSCYQNMIKLAKENPFVNIHIMDICKRSGISKVTFFKYFQQKEELLHYYFRIWTFELSIELFKNGKEGAEGIYYIFDKIADECNQHPGLLFAYTTYISNIKIPLKPYSISAAEKEILFPEIKDWSNIEILSLEQWFERFLLEAVFRKEITKSADTNELTYLLLSLFFGTVYLVNYKNAVHIKHTFRRTADQLLKGLR